MSWSDRQRRMLEAMGLKIWVPPSVGAAQAAPVGEASGAAAADGEAASVRPGALQRERVDAQAPSADVAVAERPRAPVQARAADRAAPGSAGGPPAQTQTERATGPTAERAAQVLSRALPAAVGDVMGQAMGKATAAAVGANAQADRTGLSRQAIASLDWGGLQDAVAQCRACGLCETRKNTVFGVGHSQAHWMIIGEAPGEQEDLQGEPFVGPAGKLLDNMLRALGLSRSEGPPEQQVFIANTLKCRPPRNRNPDPSELAQCEPFLQRQIELIQPRIILAMGRFAVQQLLQSQEAIGRLRGRVHRYQGVPLVVTYHPAYLLRNLPDKARAWEDLCLARQTLESGGGSPGAQ